MLILHICQRDDTDTGGSLRVAEALFQKQKLEGHDVRLLFLYGPPSNIAENFAPDVTCLGLTSSRQVLRGLNQLHKTIKQISPDIIHSHDGIYWPRLAYLNINIPIVTHSHLRPKTQQGLKQKIEWLLTKKTIDCLIGISEHTAQQWIEAGLNPSKVHIIPNGVDFQRFSIPDTIEKTDLRENLGLPTKQRLLLWVGRITREGKGTDRFELISNHMPSDITLVVVGTGPDLNPIQARCAKQIQDGKMLFTGAVSEPELYYRAADAFLFTSYNETFGLVVLEAVACGLPILSFPVNGGVVALLKEFNARTIEDNIPPEEISGILEKLFAENQDATALREKAVVKYSWGTAARKIISAYKELLEAKRKH